MKARTMTIEAAADALIAAAASGAHCQPIHTLIGDTDLDAAYAVQDRIAAARVKAGGHQTGWKVAFSAKPVMAAFAISEPASGRLFRDMEVMSGATIPWASTSQPRVEAEIAFVMRQDLASAHIGMADVLRAIDFVIPAIEVVGARIAGPLKVTDAVADNAGGSQYVPGASPRLLTGVDVADASLSLSINGKDVGTGTGRNVLGAPSNAVLWLARHLVSRGLSLKAGDIVMAGALFGPVPVSPGDAVEIHGEGLGSVAVSFGAAQPPQNAM